MLGLDTHPHLELSPKVKTQVVDSNIARTSSLFLLFFYFQIDNGFSFRGSGINLVNLGGVEEVLLGPLTLVTYRRLLAA
jgi:hypothetical protein